MIRLSFFTDLHLRGQGPISRKDDYPETILGKLKDCIQHASESDLALFGGDFCHTYRLNADQVKEKAIHIFDEHLKVPFLYTWGQHDLYGKDYGTRHLSTQAFIFRQASRVIENIEEIPTDKDLVKDIQGLKIGFLACPNSSDPIKWSMRVSSRKRPKDIDIRVVLVHHLLMDKLDEHYGIDLREFKTENDGKRSIDVVLCGDLHQGFNPTITDIGTLFINPGSLARTQKNEYDVDRPIRGVDILIDPKTKKYKWEMWNVESALTQEEVFKEGAPFIDEKVGVSFDDKEVTEAEFEEVAKSLANIGISRIDVWDMLEKRAIEVGLPDDTITYILSKRPSA